MLLRQYWYVAATADEVGSKPFARKLLGEPVVFFRDRAGTVHALEDRCPHRSMPLSVGSVEGDVIRCGYHGLEFAGSGACIRVPGQSTIPPNAAARHYPVIERYGQVWIWMGDPAAADPKQAHVFEPMERPGWSASRLQFHVLCDWRLLVENLLDFTHLTFVHESTIGSREVTEEADVGVTRAGDRVTVSRRMSNITPAPTYAKATGIYGNIDRWQDITFAPPSFVTVEAGVAPTRDMSRALQRYSLHGITPETETTMHYFWTSAYEVAAHKPETIALLADQFRVAFEEDVAILAHQQRRRRNDLPFVDTNADAGNMQVRRVLAALAAREAPPLRASA